MVYPLSLAPKLQHAIQQSRHKCLSLCRAHLFDFKTAVCDDVDLFSFQSFFSLKMYFPEKKAQKKRNTLFCHENVLRLSSATFRFNPRNTGSAFSIRHHHSWLDTLHTNQLYCDYSFFCEMRCYYTINARKKQATKPIFIHIF